MCLWRCVPTHWAGLRDTPNTPGMASGDLSPTGSFVPPFVGFTEPKEPCAWTGYKEPTAICKAPGAPEHYEHGAMKLGWLVVGEPKYLMVDNGHWLQWPFVFLCAFKNQEKSAAAAKGVGQARFFYFCFLRGTCLGPWRCNGTEPTAWLRSGASTCRTGE